MPPPRERRDRKMIHRAGRTGKGAALESIDRTAIVRESSRRGESKEGDRKADARASRERMKARRGPKGVLPRSGRVGGRARAHHAFSPGVGSRRATRGGQAAFRPAWRRSEPRGPCAPAPDGGFQTLVHGALDCARNGPMRPPAPSFPRGSSISEAGSLRSARLSGPVPRAP